MTHRGYLIKIIQGTGACDRKLSSQKMLIELESRAYRKTAWRHEVRSPEPAFKLGSSMPIIPALGRGMGDRQIPQSSLVGQPGQLVRLKTQGELSLKKIRWRVTKEDA